eukprot:403341229
MAKSDNFDLFQWIYISLTSLGLITFILFTKQYFKYYPNIKNYFAQTSIVFIVLSFLAELVLKAIALLGVEIRGKKFGDYVDNQDLYMDDTLLCCYNLSNQAPDYLLVMGVLLLQIKWGRIAFNCLQIKLGVLLKQFIYLGFGLLFFLIIVACIAEVHQSCPHILIKERHFGNDSFDIALYSFYAGMLISIDLGFLMTGIGMKIYYTKRIAQEHLQILPKKMIITSCEIMRKKLFATFVGLVVFTTLRVVIVFKQFLAPETPDFNFGLLEKPNNLISLLQALIAIFYIGLLGNLIKLQLMALDLEQRAELFPEEQFEDREGRFQRRALTTIQELDHESDTSSMMSQTDFDDQMQNTKKFPSVGFIRSKSKLLKFQEQQELIRKISEYNKQPPNFSYQSQQQQISSQVSYNNQYIESKNSGSSKENLLSKDYQNNSQYRPRKYSNNIQDSDDQQQNNLNTPNRIYPTLSPSSRQQQYEQQQLTHASSQLQYGTQINTIERLSTSKTFQVDEFSPYLISSPGGINDRDSSQYRDLNYLDHSIKIETDINSSR